MTEHPTPETQTEKDIEPGTSMPRWVPMLIGAVLVIMAALAVYTGVRYRENGGALTPNVQSRRERATTAAPPGEPGAGASRVLHGSESEDNTPSANEPVQGSARAVISGGPGGVETTVRIWARRGMMLEVTPATAMVYVNDTLIGHVNQFDTEDEIYDFPAAGSYTVRVVAANKQKTYIVTAATDAKQNIAHIKAAF